MREESPQNRRWPLDRSAFPRLGFDGAAGGDEFVPRRAPRAQRTTLVCGVTVARKVTAVKSA